MADTKAAPPAKSGKKGLILLILVGIFSVAGGIFVPRFLLGGAAKTEKEEKKERLQNKAFVPFGDVVVNLSEERLTRYVRVKLTLVIDGEREKQDTELITKQKPVLKSWLIGHLADKSLKDVSGKAGVNRLRREIVEQFNLLLDPSGPDKILDILFDEFVVQ